MQIGSFEIWDEWNLLFANKIKTIDLNNKWK